MSILAPSNWRHRGYPDPYLPAEVEELLDLPEDGDDPSLLHDAREFRKSLPRTPDRNLRIPRDAQAVVLAAAQIRQQIVESGEADLDKARYGMTRALSVLGMWAFKRQLEDMLLELEFPERFRGFQKRLCAFQAEHEEFTRSVEDSVRDGLAEIGMTAGVSTVWCGVDGASRRLESLRLPNFDLAQPMVFYDTYVLVETAEDCYRALQAVHQVGPPAPDGFQDLIVAPNSNGFSGLVTQIQVRRTFGGKPKVSEVRVILQTHLMHEIGWHGITHPDCTAAPADQPPFISGLRSIQGRSVGVRPTIIVYAQGGDSRRLQREAHEMEAGATVLDLAYKIHSELGNEALSAVVDGEWVESLGQVLEDGAVVEIHPAPENRKIRSEDDLDLVTLPSSRRHLKRSLYQRDSTAKGRLAVLQQLKERGFSIPADELDRLVEAVAGRLVGESELRTPEEIYRNVGRLRDLSDRKAEAEKGGFEQERARLAKELAGLNESVSYASVAALVADEVVRVGFERLLPGDSPTDQWRPALREDPDFRVRLATLCAVCRPGPKDEEDIVGRRRGSQVKVHRRNCRYATGPDLLGMHWVHVQGRVRAILNISGVDRSGLVIDVCERVAHLGCGLEQISARADHLGKARLTLHVYADSSATVESLTADLGRIRGVAAVDEESMQLPAVGETPARDDAEERATGRSVAGPLALHLRPTGPPLRHGLIRIPYDPQRPCFDGPFIGRHDESDRLVRRMRGGVGPSLFIAGPRTIGKSSLALRFCDRLDEQLRPHALRVDLRSCKYFNSRETFEKIVEEFRKSPYAAPGVPDGDHPRRTLDALVDACDRHLLLILDEFGGPLESFSSGRLDGEFFAWIRSAMDERSPKLTVMMAGPPDAELLLRTRAQRELGERLKTFRLGVLTPDATRQMFTEPLADEGISVKPDARDAVIAMCGGHPFYLIELLRKVVRRLDRERGKWEVTRSDISRSLDDLLVEDLPLSGWISEIAPSLPAQLCLDGFVRAGGRKNQFVDIAKIARYAQLDSGEVRSAMEVLQRCHVVEAGTEDPSEYRIMFPILSEWIRRGGIRHDHLTKLDGYSKRCLAALSSLEARDGLTVPQVARAMDLDSERAEETIEELVAEGVLAKRRSRYRLAVPLLGTWFAEERQRRQSRYVGG